MIKTVYPVSDPNKYLSGDWKLLEKNLAGRLSALAKDCGAVLKITEGKRSTERQEALYNQYLAYKRTGKGNIKMAAKPGTSKHEYGIAADTSTQPVRSMNNSQLAKYGLHKPIKSEPWHIEIIETKNNPNWKQLVEEEDMTKEEVKTLLQGERDTPSTWAREGVQWAVSNKILADDKNLDGTITKEQLAVILYRILGTKK